VTGVRFYKGQGNGGTHVGYLYAGTARVGTVTFTGETATGWQQALFTTPIPVAVGTTYTVTYVAPQGRYAGDGSYPWPKTANGITGLGSVYRYGPGTTAPTLTYGGSNYYVDVVAELADVTTPPVDPPVDPPSGVLNLPRIPWEGGPQYWAQFPKAAAAGWTNPAFFPIAINPAPFSSADEVQWDKAHGINTYCGGLNEWSPWQLLQDNGMFLVGGRYAYQGNMMPADFPNLVGYLMDDEVDGTHTPEAGFAYLQGLEDQLRGLNDGRFLHNNYTQQVALSAWAPGEQYVNAYQDNVCMDMYWYTIPNSSYPPGTSGQYVCGPIANPRSATAYGAMVRALRIQDAKDGKRQAIWFYIENLSGGPGEQFVRYITPAEVKGAVMSSIINEARGIVWFNSAMSGPAGGGAVGNVIRQAQVNPNFVGKTQVEAMGQVNLQVQRLAPVINTQSYQWSFGTGLETMLKAQGGSAYIFAMCANGSTPGSRTFTLPAGVTGSTVEVVDESRTLPVSGGKFTDTFAAEYSYHVYRIAL
jgi:hypothetical protein